MKTELLVGLKIPDTTAVTALRTLQRLEGLELVQHVTRYDHYTLEAPGDVYHACASCDILVNANKNTAAPRLAKQKGCAYVLVWDIHGCEGLRSTLNLRLGFSITRMRKGTLWELRIDAQSEDERETTARKAAQDLLYNPHYQEYVIL